MKKLFIILGTMLFLLAGCTADKSVSNEKYLDLMVSLTNNRGEVVTLDMDAEDFYTVVSESNINNITETENDNYIFDGMDIRVKDGKIVAMAVSDNQNGNVETLWSTPTGIVLGMAKDEIISFYPQVAEEDWQYVGRKGNYSDIKLTNKIDGRTYILGFLFDETDTLVLICTEYE